MAPKGHKGPPGANTPVRPGQDVSSPPAAPIRRSNRDRRPSRDALESVATEADLHELDGQRGPDPPPSSSQPSSSSSSSSSKSGTQPSPLPSSSSSVGSGDSGRGIPPLSHDQIGQLLSLVESFREAVSGGSSTSHDRTRPSPRSNDSKSPLSTDPVVGDRAPNPIPPSWSSNTHRPHGPNTPRPSSLMAGRGRGGDDASADSDDESGGDGDDGAPLVCPGGPVMADLEWKGQVIAGDDRLAPRAIRIAESDFGSFSARWQFTKYRDARNNHEMENLSTMMDALLAGQVEWVCELMVRRMIAIDEADKHGHWRMAAGLAVRESGSLLGIDHRRRITKVAKLVEWAGKDVATNGRASRRAHSSSSSSSYARPVSPRRSSKAARRAAKTAQKVATSSSTSSTGGATGHK